MGKLIDPARARKAREAREERSRRILEAADAAFGKFPYTEITLDTIGIQAGVKQGQASLAFRSREELYLTVLLARLDEWYGGLEAGLRDAPDPVTAERVAADVAATLADRPELTRMLGPLFTALELHEDGIEVHRFLKWQRDRLLGVAGVVAELAPDLHRWDVFDALYRAQLTAAAIHPVSRPVGNLAVDLVADDHQVFALDLEDEVRRVVLDSLGG